MGEGRTNGKRLKARPGPAALATDDWARVARMFGPLKLTPEQLRAFPASPGSDEEPWDVLLAMLGLDEQTALTRLGERTGLSFIPEPRLHESASRFYELVPVSFARRHHVAGLSSDGHVVLIATGQPMQPGVFNRLEDMLQMPLRIVLSPRGAVANLINRGYEQQQDLVTEIVEEIPLDERAIQTAAGSISQATDLLQLARQGPVIRLVNMILFEALRRRASDIHVHPLENRLVIRYRIDGMLVDAFSPPPSLGSAISSRLKVMTDLDIANRHSPQDGQTTVRIGSHKIDIRMSAIPTVYGERIVLRLLDQTQTQLDLDAVGMSGPMQDQLVDLIDRPNGMILVTGPTGSGKTTTLYAALGRIDRSSRNVMTVEDPVEYHLEGISQMQVNPKRNVTFATGLRALLRQDPDVILVGEIRDRETAELAIQASLTGHMVLATLHTNDAPSAIPRLVDIGIPPYLITSSLLAVLAQRLLRRVCSVCGGTGGGPPGGSALRADTGGTGESALRTDTDGSQGRSTGGDGPESRPAGSPAALPEARCEACFGTGFRGRVGAFEIMLMNDELRQLTAQNADAVSLFEAARRNGFRTMLDDAKEKVAAGRTTEAELRRVLH